jgi:hypothetical protein
MDLPRGDRGDVVLGWLTKVTVTLALLGLVGFDAVSLGAGQFQAEDHAQQAARAAVEAYRTTPDLQKAYDAAVGEVLDDGDTIETEGFAAGADGSITLRLRREVPTLLVEKIPPLRDLATVIRTVTGTPAS